MSCLPLEQLSKSQRSAVELQIEPDAKIVQSYLRGQASLKSRQVMRTFPGQAERVQQLVIDGFNHLPQTGQPATQGFGPALPLVVVVMGGLRSAGMAAKVDQLFTCVRVQLSSIGSRRGPAMPMELCQQR